MSNRQISEVTSLLMVARNAISNESNWVRGQMASEYRGEKAYCAQGALGYAWAKKTGEYKYSPHSEDDNIWVYNNFIASIFWKQANLIYETPINKACELLVEHLPNYEGIKQQMEFHNCSFYALSVIPEFNNMSNHKDVLEWFDRTIATSIKRDQEVFANV